MNEPQEVHMLNSTKRILGDVLGLSAAPVVLHVGAIAIGAGVSPLLALPALALSGVVTATVLGNNVGDWLHHRQSQKEDSDPRVVYSSGLVGSILNRRHRLSCSPPQTPSSPKMP